MEQFKFSENLITFCIVTECNQFTLTYERKYFGNWA